MARECKIEQDGGKITVQLSVDNGIISGSDFVVFKFDTGAVMNTFKMHTGVTGSVTHLIDMDANEAMGNVLSWQILSCTPIITDSCNLDVEIFQDGSKCLMNKLAHYELDDVPGCALSKALPVKGGLRFVKQLTQ
ncbi:MAG: hypothetical protein ABIR18_04820 [Chitinophagaceae bacterium]